MYRLLIVFSLSLLLIPPTSLIAGSSDFTVISSDSNGVLLEYSIPVYKIKPADDGMQEIVFDSAARLHRRGEPDLPVEKILIAVMDDITDVSIEVLEDLASGHETSGISPVPEVKYPTGSLAEPVFIYNKNPDIYLSDALFPRQSVKKGFLGYFREQRILQLKLFPIQFNPQKHELLVHDKMLIKITYIYGEDDKSYKNTQKQRYVSKKKIRDPLFEKIYLNNLVNYNNLP